MTCKGFRVVPPGSGQYARRMQRLIDFLVEETLATPDCELPPLSAADEKALRDEIDRAIAKARGETPIQEDAGTPNKLPATDNG